MGKAFNDDWMRDRGFLDNQPKTALDLISSHQHLPLVTVAETDEAKEAFEKMEKYGISQLPVVDANNEFVGSLTDTHIFKLLLNDPEVNSKQVKQIMQEPFPVVGYYEEIDAISKAISQGNPAVLMRDLGGVYHIITKYDVISALAR